MLFLVLADGHHIRFVKKDDEHIDILFDHTVNDHTYQLHLADESDGTQKLFNEIELFVDWQYKFEVAKETYLMLYTGPTLQCGLSLDVNHYLRNDLTDEVEPNRYSAYNTDVANEHLTRLNITWGVGAGFQYKRYFLRGGYDFGLINPYANKEFVDVLDQPTGRYTRGRLDQWSIKIGMYIWYEE